MVHQCRGSRRRWRHRCRRADHGARLNVSTLAQDHDCLLLDLDGTVFRGHEPSDGADETLAAVRPRVLFVTNNASSGPAEVAQHLSAMGFAAKPADVVTSAQSAARLLQ